MPIGWRMRPEYRQTTRLPDVTVAGRGVRGSGSAGLKGLRYGIGARAGLKGLRYGIGVQRRSSFNKSVLIANAASAPSAAATTTH